MLLQHRNTVLAFIVTLSWLFAHSALANGWGESQAPAFRYNSQGLSNEVYRVQLGVSAVSSAVVTRPAAGNASGGSGTGQSSDQLNNVVQIHNNATYNVSIQGHDNYLNFNTTVDAQQTSTGSSMSTSNSGTQYIQDRSGTTSSSTYLNR